jgi:hypothetical protein
MQSMAEKQTYLIFPENAVHLLSRQAVGVDDRVCRDFPSAIDFGITNILLFPLMLLIIANMQLAFVASTLLALLVSWIVYSIHKMKALKIVEARSSKPPVVTVLNRKQIRINDVQRVDSSTANTRGTGLGLGVNVGMGVVVGGGKGSATTTISTSIAWQFYTSIGIITVNEHMYNAWLNAGQPTEAVILEKLVEYK